MNHKAPAVAPEIQALRSLTRTQGDEQLVEDLDQLLWQINAPDHLRAFIWLINRLQVITLSNSVEN